MKFFLGEEQLFRITCDLGLIYGLSLCADTAYIYLAVLKDVEEEHFTVLKAVSSDLKRHLIVEVTFIVLFGVIDLDRIFAHPAGAVVPRDEAALGDIPESRFHDHLGLFAEQSARLDRIFKAQHTVAVGLEDNGVGLGVDLKIVGTLAVNGVISHQKDSGNRDTQKYDSAELDHLLLFGRELFANGRLAAGSHTK